MGLEKRNTETVEEKLDCISLCRRGRAQGLRAIKRRFAPLATGARVHTPALSLTHTPAGDASQPAPADRFATKSGLRRGVEPEPVLLDLFSRSSYH